VSDERPKVLILGTRGIPAAHGGFETFAERLALHLVAHGWTVGVYCQRETGRRRSRITRDAWNGIERMHVEVGCTGPKATLLFDWLCVRHAAKQDGVCLVLGYNGAMFLPYLRLRGRPVITNMDGIEWQRPKWSRAVRGWFYVNEWIAARSSHRMIADHPEIARHLSRRYPGASIATIPYGADPVMTAPDVPVLALGLHPDRYLLSVSRIEPDNSVLEIVQAFSRAPRGLNLVVVGNVDGNTAYGRAVRDAASKEVVFPGSIYDPATLRSLRFHARAYMHGHTAGGTNPSLVEALWAGNAVVAHDNRFNRWTADGAGLFFRNATECAAHIEAVASEVDLVAALRQAARTQAAVKFEWADVFAAYEREFLSDSPFGADLGREPVPQLKRRSI
jgi:glycosyltransferase involved in cell wall biosynthesis